MKKTSAPAVAKKAKPPAQRQQAAQHGHHAGGGSGAAPRKASGKHAGTSKHQPAKAGKHTQTRSWSLDSDMPVCSARAVAQALRIASGPVLSDSDVLTLHRYAGGAENRSVTILAALSAFYGLAAGAGAFRFALTAPEIAGTGDEVQVALHQVVPELLGFGSGHALILGLDLPGGEPHAVTVDLAGVWWSWGEPWQPPADAVIEEAWTVTL